MSAVHVVLHSYKFKAVGRGGRGGWDIFSVFSAYTVRERKLLLGALMV